jgi:Zn-dependent protease/CBS domain-containing protein
MKWSWKIAEYSGIGVYIHATFLLLLIWIGTLYWLQAQSVLYVLSGVAFIIVLFGCVVLHEFGHALTAKRFGIKTRDITLYPIGGVARLEKMPDDPRQELLVAVAGPAVNVLIAIIIGILLAIKSAFVPLTELSLTGGSFLQRLMLVNLFLVFFNLIPAFPMDGGRVLRALLAMRMDYVQATQYAATMGQAVSLIFGFLGLLFNPFLLFIAFFVWIGAAQEAHIVILKSALAGIPVSKVMLTEFKSLSPSDPLSKGVDLILSGFQQDFPVISEGKVVGVLTRKDLLEGLAGKNLQTNVGEVMQKQFITVEPGDILDAAFQRLQDCSCTTLPVLYSGELVGLLTSENLGEFLMIKSAIKAKGSTWSF